MHTWAELRDSGWWAGRVSEFTSFSTTKSTCFIPRDGVFAFQGVPGGHQLTALTSYTLRTRRSWFDKTGGGVLVASDVSTRTLWVMVCFFTPSGILPSLQQHDTGSVGLQLAATISHERWHGYLLQGRWAGRDMAAYCFIFSKAGQWRNFFPTHITQKIVLVSGSSLIYSLLTSKSLEVPLPLFSCSPNFIPRLYPATVFTLLCSGHWEGEGVASTFMFGGVGVPDH
ncbi:hypothetical protein MPH_01031 [Macrophomina phaseolina MS6]|uniref:Uncharacterized protein n=1 Tax=Macrophomina phaseolina (strain MS6) TaxID=1126212 RepID=K2RGH4_MACPH|nr:hypothetical protein MPH_01031 [Macrophomina phaseolina MS6]